MGNRSKLLIGILAVVLIAGGAAAFYLNNNKPAVKKDQAQQKVHSPAEIAGKYREYIDKEVAVRGSIFNGGTNGYVLISPDDKSRSALRLDFSKTDLNPEKYVEVIRAQDSPQKAEQKDYIFTVKGKLVLKKESEKESSLYLVVESID